MSYVLLGSIRSPFVRICRMLMIQGSIDYEFRVLDFVENANDAAALRSETPINKVPVLMDGKQKIFDSRVIANFLIEKHGLRPLSLDEENIVSAIYSCLDTAVILFLMKRDGFDMSDEGFFLSRQRARIPDNLAYVTPWAKTLDPAKPGDWNYASMILYCFLYWGERRLDFFKVKDDPDLAAFMEKFKNATGVDGTGF